MGLLDGKVAIVTGAGGGIGRCHALLLSQHGASVVVNDLGGTCDGIGGDNAMADKVVKEIEAGGGKAVPNYDSVANYEGAQGIVKTALDAFGRADILVSNAGILRDKSLLKMEEAMWDAVIAVHLKGSYLVGQAFARHVKERADAGDPGGRIVNTSSYAGLMGNFGQTNYGAAKAGIAGLTRVWAQELARIGVTVNCIAPMAKTRMTEDIAMVPEEMKPEQVAPMALFLASDLAKDVTGRIFGVHGQQLLEYRMTMTEGATKEGSELWTAEEIASSLEDIAAMEHEKAPAGAAPAAPAGPGAVIDQAFSRMPEVFLPARAKGWKAVIQFDIQGADPWTVTVADGTCTTAKGKKGEPTCVVTVDAETYAAVVKGELKPEKAFMAGKIRATNLGDMMKFGGAFDMKKAKELAKKAAASQAAPAPAPAAPAGPGAVIDQAFSRMPEVFLPARAKGWKAVIQFDIQGADPWTVTVADGTCTTAKGKKGEPTCVVTVDAETYAAVVKGELKPEKAFMAGKIRATNLGDMMKFGGAFDMKKAKELAKKATAGAPAAAPAAPAGPGAVIDRAFTLLPQLFLPGRAKGWQAVMHFDIGGADPWTVLVADGKCSTSKGLSGEATCVVKVDAETYAAVVKGELKPEKAFMSGKIRATNLGDMMKFGGAFDMKKAKELAKQEGKKLSAGGAAQGGAPAAPGTPQEHVTLAFSALPQVFKPMAVSGWKANLHFELAGGEDWSVKIEAGKCETQPGKHGEPTCLVKTSLEDYALVLKGELRAEQAFMQKRITASNLGEMMKFGRAFDLPRLKEVLASAPTAAPSSSGGLNRDFVGKRYDGAEPIFVSPDHSQAYAQATQDLNPAYEGEGAMTPPLFAVRLLKDVLFSMVGDDDLGADLMNLVHGEQDMEFLRPLRPWDLCATRAWVTGVEDKSTGQLLRVREEVYAGGQLAVRVNSSMFIRDPSKRKNKASKKDAAPTEAPSATFSEEVKVPVDGGPLYAEASLDNNPIHTDEEVAKLAGFPGVILQGLCTMAFASKALVSQVAGGDPARLSRLSVRFSKPVLMGDVLTTEGWPLDEEGAYGFRVVNQEGVEVIQAGRAEVRTQ
jgi:NAD(P)-dependent dehydrogenase (short-subunit alcohol dehydrogenase family)/putative sterol carrier protein/acyl dehydratase